MRQSIRSITPTGQLYYKSYVVDARNCLNVDVPSGSLGAFLALSETFPNPARGVVNLRITTPDNAPIKLTVFDVAGRAVSRQRFEGVGPGTHVLKLQPRQTLRPGVYYIELRHPLGARRKTVVVLN